MTDTALQAQGRALGGLQAKRQIVMDRAFQSATAFFAFLVLVILGGVFVSLVMGALPALSTFGFSFAYMQVWNPVTEKFGALAPIYGTLVTALIAMAVGIPISFGIAVFLTEIWPHLAEAPGRHRDRTAGRHPQHHLRHLGPFRLRAVLPADAPAVPDRHGRRAAADRPRCSPGRPMASASSPPG